MSDFNIANADKYIFSKPQLVAYMWARGYILIICSSRQLEFSQYIFKIFCLVVGLYPFYIFGALGGLWIPIPDQLNNRKQYIHILW